MYASSRTNRNADDKRFSNLRILEIPEVGRFVPYEDGLHCDHTERDLRHKEDKRPSERIVAAKVPQPGYFCHVGVNLLFVAFEYTRIYSCAVISLCPVSVRYLECS